MELTKTTQAALKNFSLINTNFVFDPSVSGNKTIMTINEHNNIFAKYVLEDEILEPFAIYDLNEFLSALSLVNTPYAGSSGYKAPANPHMDFDSIDAGVLRISGEDRVLEYVYSDPEIHNMNYPRKDLTQAVSDLDDGNSVSIELSRDDINNFRKACSVIGVSNFYITSHPGNSKVLAEFRDSENQSSNTFRSTIAHGDSWKPYDFSFRLFAENLKCVSGNYTLILSDLYPSLWIPAESNIPKIHYLIAVEKPSHFTRNSNNQ